MKNNGKDMKQSRGIVRVSGSPLNKPKVFEVADQIVTKLNNGEWDGRKKITVK